MGFMQPTPTVLLIDPVELSLFVKLQIFCPNLWDCGSIWALMDEAACRGRLLTFPFSSLHLLFVRFGCFGQANARLDKIITAMFNIRGLLSM